MALTLGAIAGLIFAWASADNSDAQQADAQQQRPADITHIIEGVPPGDVAAQISKDAGYAVYVPRFLPRGQRLVVSTVRRIQDPDTGTVVATTARLDTGDEQYDAKSGYSRLPAPPAAWARIAITEQTGEHVLPQGERLELTGAADGVNLERAPGATAGGRYSAKIGETTVIVEVLGAGTLPSDDEMLAMIRSMVP